MINAFADETTLHGLPRIIKPSTVFRRVFWFILFTAAVSLLIWQSSELLRKFTSFQKAVSVEVIQGSVNFPAITICSQNSIQPLVKESIHNHIKGYNMEDVLRVPNYKYFKELQVNPYTENCSSQKCDFERDYLKWFSNIAKSASTFNLDSYKIDHFFLPANIELSKSASQSLDLDDILYMCKFNEDSCSVVNFTVNENAHYLRCFTFKTNQIARHGRKRGLSLYLKYPRVPLRISKKNLLPGISNPHITEGYNIFIHPAGSQPSFGEEGINISPGVKASLGFKVTSYARIGHPYGNCSFRRKLHNSNSSYSSMSCSNEILQERVQSMCNCTDISLPYSRTYEEANLPFCRRVNLPSECDSNALFWNNVDYFQPESFSHVPKICTDIIKKMFGSLDCMKRARSSTGLHSNFLNIECPAPCQEIRYEVKASNTPWPSSENFFHTLGYILTENNETQVEMMGFIYNWTYNSTTLDNFRSQFIQVNVFLEDADLTYVREHVMYEWYQMLSELGGLLGLYIGMSIMTLFELFELGITSLCKKRSTSKVHNIMK